MDDYISREEKMEEYISREAALEAVREGLGLECGVVEDLDVEDNEVYLNVKNLPAADVRPVVHGKWIDIKMDHCSITDCSVCGSDFVMKYFSNAKYCPECGARMDGGNNG